MNIPIHIIDHAAFVATLPYGGSTENLSEIERLEAIRCFYWTILHAQPWSFDDQEELKRYLDFLDQEISDEIRIRL